MRFLKLRLDAFHEFCPVEIPLTGRGLVLVEGVNLDSSGAYDSNGAGKSLLFEAICWVLWNTMPRYRGKWLTSEVADENGRADASLWIEIHGAVYRLRRWRTKSTVSNLVIQREGEPEPRAFDAKRAVEDINKLVGFDFETLRAALFLQGLGMDFAQSKFENQNSMLESVLRFYILSDAREFADADRKEAAQVFAVTDARRQPLAHAVQQARAYIESVKQTPDNTARIVEAERRIQSLLDETDEATILTPLIVRVSESDAEVARAKVESTEARMVSMDAGRLLLEAENRLQVGRGGKCPTCGAITKEATLSDVDRETLERRIRALQDGVRAAESGGRQADTDYQTAVRLRSDLVAQINSLRDRRKGLLPSLQDALQTLQDEAARHQDQLRDLRKQLKVAEVELATAEQDALAAKARLDGAAIWVKGFPDLKAKFLKLATPVLNGYAAVHSLALADGQLNVIFEPEREKRTQDILRIVDERGRARDYASCSAGERRRIDLIASLALRSLARWRMADAINLTLYDEVFDPLDQAGIGRVVGLLQRDVEELESVFVITHNPALKREFPGAQTLRVIKRGHKIEVQQ